MIGWIADRRVAEEKLVWTSARTSARSLAQGGSGLQLSETRVRRWVGRLLSGFSIAETGIGSVPTEGKIRKKFWTFGKPWFLHRDYVATTRRLRVRRKKILYGVSRAQLNDR